MTERRSIVDGRARRLLPGSATVACRWHTESVIASNEKSVKLRQTQKAFARFSELTRQFGQSDSLRLVEAAQSIPSILARRPQSTFSMTMNGAAPDRGTACRIVARRTQRAGTYALSFVIIVLGSEFSALAKLYAKLVDNALKYVVPIATALLSKKPDSGIPGTIVSADQPPPFAVEREQDPGPLG